MKENIMFLICGTAFSGKTTLSKKIAQLTSFSRISFDEINEKKGYFPGDDIPQNVWAKTSEEAVLKNHLNVFEKPGSDEKVIIFNPEKDDIDSLLNKV